jgi:hypothetical protein
LAFISCVISLRSMPALIGSRAARFHQREASSGMSARFCGVSMASSQVLARRPISGTGLTMMPEAATTRSNASPKRSFDWRSLVGSRFSRCCESDIPRS